MDTAKERNRTHTPGQQTVRRDVAVDGAAAGNPGPGGWAWYIDDGCWCAGGEKATTNNRMELIAAIEALAALSGPLRLVCDSRYVVDCATKWMRSWKRRNWRKADGSEVKNQDLLQALDRALVGRDVEFFWVKAHNGHGLNEAADVRARAAAEAFRDAHPVNTGPGTGGR